MSAPVRRRVHVEGVVQGVGFRPFAYGLATELGLAGFVANDGGGVVLEIEGSEGGVAELLDRLGRMPPCHASIERIVPEWMAVRGEDGFAIAPSRDTTERGALVSPDRATCDDCLRELADPHDRRFGYAFITCNACGPRYTIVEDVPYDRAATTMARFTPCADCAREYDDPRDRRFHAQSIACPACGPRLALATADGTPIAGDPVAEAARLLRGGAIVAVKGLGGHHLTALASDATAVAALRTRKHREAKPFAVMVADVDGAHALAHLSDADEALLRDPRRPIVLCDVRDDAALAPAVAPGSRLVGLLLPYTPLHHLLLAAVGAPIVCTSGNASDEPIAFDDDDARSRLASIADAFLGNDRPIHAPADDSVARVVAGVPRLVRRARGWAPDPVRLPWDAERPILACGAGLKSTFCLASGSHAFVSPHIGDLDHPDAVQAFRDGVARWERLFGIEPAVVAHDLHPDYASTRYARAREGVERIGVQHHHAHVVACLVEHGECGPVIGVAFDGLGYGPDGSLWGGEFLVADAADFRRVAHLEQVAMPGGSTAVRQPWRMAAAHLAAIGEPTPRNLAVAERHATWWGPVLAGVKAGVNAPLTSSAGRLFDAASAILGIRDVAVYEGQAAAELEQRVDRAERGAYHAGIRDDATLRVRGGDLIAALVADLRAGEPVGRIAARFHNGVADAIARTCAAVREREGLAVVVLAGGVFQNAHLLVETTARLVARGFRVLAPARLPANDGAISIGQAAVAAARQDIRDGASRPATGAANGQEVTTCVR